MGDLGEAEAAGRKGSLGSSESEAGPHVQAAVGWHLGARPRLCEQVSAFPGETCDGGGGGASGGACVPPAAVASQVSGRS